MQEASLWGHLTRITCSVCRPPWAPKDEFDEDLARAGKPAPGDDFGAQMSRGNVCVMLANSVLYGAPSLGGKAPSQPAPDDDLDAKKAAHRLIERANMLQNRGADANRRGDPHEAYRLFERASNLVPHNPVHVLSAANMQLKIALAAPTSRLSPAFRAAIELYDRARALRLTDAQSKLLEQKRAVAEEAMAQASETMEMTADIEARAQAAARNSVTQIALSPTKNGRAARDGDGGDANLTPEQRQALLDLGLDALPATREMLRAHVRILLKTFHPDKQAERPEGLRLEPTVATTFIRRIKLAAARLLEAIDDEGEGYYV